MEIEIFYFDGCPNYASTAKLVRDLVQRLGLDATIQLVAVRDAEGAARARFFGSPTIQVNGEDIDPSARNRVDYSISCRMYGGSGSPPQVLVEEALRRFRKAPSNGEDT